MHVLKYVLVHISVHKESAIIAGSLHQVFAVGANLYKFYANF